MFSLMTTKPRRASSHAYRLVQPILSEPPWLTITHGSLSFLSTLTGLQISKVLLYPATSMVMSVFCTLYPPVVMAFESAAKTSINAVKSASSRQLPFFVLKVNFFSFTIVSPFSIYCRDLICRTCGNELLYVLPPLFSSLFVFWVSMYTIAQAKYLSTVQSHIHLLIYYICILFVKKLAAFVFLFCVALLYL